MASKNNRAAAFACQIKDAFASVREIVTYVDTVQFLIKPQDVARTFHFLAGLRFIPRETGHRIWPVSIRMHQPVASVLADLAGHLSEHLVTRLDVARDYVVDDQEAAEKLQQFLFCHLTQRWHGKRRASIVEGETMYLSAAGRGRNAAAYATRPSKVTGQPCAHVEVRITGAGQTRRLGVESLSAIPQVDLIGILKRELRLTLINWDHLDGQLRTVADNSIAKWKDAKIEFSSREEAHRKVRSIICRALAYSEADVTLDQMYNVPAQCWLEACAHLIGDGVVHRPIP